MHYEITVRILNCLIIKIFIHVRRSLANFIVKDHLHLQVLISFSLQDKTLRILWEDALSISLRETDRLCEVHFRDEDIVSFFETKMADGTIHLIKRKMKALKNNSIPVKTSRNEEAQVDHRVLAQRASKILNSPIFEVCYNFHPEISLYIFFILQVFSNFAMKDILYVIVSSRYKTVLQKIFQYIWILSYKIMGIIALLLR